MLKIIDASGVFPQGLNTRWCKNIYCIICDIQVVLCKKIITFLFIYMKIFCKRNITNYNFKIFFILSIYYSFHLFI